MLTLIGFRSEEGDQDRLCTGYNNTALRTANTDGGVWVGECVGVRMCARRCIYLCLHVVFTGYCANGCCSVCVVEGKCSAIVPACTNTPHGVCHIALGSTDDSSGMNSATKSSIIAVFVLVVFVSHSHVLFK